MVSGENVYGSRNRNEWQKQLPSSVQTRAERLYDHLDFLLEQKTEAERDLLREAKKHPIFRIIETAPGFGGIRAARLIPIVVTPHRFRTKRQFWTYCGLGIVTRSSSDWVQAADGSWLKARVPQTRGLTRQHNHFLKSIFKGAATTVITQRNKDPIYSRYERLVDGGTKPNLAKLSLARMIAATVLRMWKDEKGYDSERAGLHQNKHED
jgi:transposase